MTVEHRRSGWRGLVGCRSGWIVGGLVGAWLTLVGVGTMSMVIYDSTAGARAKAPARWPGRTALRGDGKQPTLLIFLHPRCPCGKSSLTEFEAVVRACPEARAVAVFYEPEGTDSTWLETEITRRARAIPGVAVVLDHRGEEAERFGVSTSGDVLAYDAEGALVFEGGLTAGRGVAGECPTRRGLIDALRGGRASALDAPVYGCAIFDDGGVGAVGNGGTR